MYITPSTEYNQCLVRTRYKDRLWLLHYNQNKFGGSYPGTLSALGQSTPPPPPPHP